MKDDEKKVLRETRDLFTEWFYIMPSEMEVRKSNETLIWCLLVAAACCDAKYYRIPNKLIGLGYITGLMTSITKSGTGGVITFAYNLIMPVILLYILYMLNGLGAGDIKLFSVVSTMIGTANTMKVIVYSIILAGSVAIILCIKEQAIVKRKLHFSYYILAGLLVLRLSEELLI